MTNRIAIIIGGLIILGILGDVLFFGTEHLIFLGKKMFEFMEWIAFWR